MHAYRPGGGQARTKLLYLFRSPTHLQVGRKALEAEVREALEHTHPDLTFDWNGLIREAPPIQRQMRPEGKERERSSRATRPAKAAGRPERPQARPPALPEDESALGQVVGASEAARLRQRYAELGQRIARRARTPEERDALTAELAATNPDAWTGDDIKTRAREADRAWEAIAAQLPRRRRGRRGGRAEGPDHGGPADVIIGERDDSDVPEQHDHTPQASDDLQTSAAPGGDSGGDRELERAAAPAAIPDAAAAAEPEVRDLD